MDMNFANAVSAYGKTLQSGSGIDARDAGGENFKSALENFIGGTKDTLRAAEAQSMKGLSGTTDLTDIVAAIGKAELTLQAVVAVRDKVISGYQEIMRMPV